MTGQWLNVNKLIQLTHEEFAHEDLLVCFGLNQEFDNISNDVVTKSVYEVGLDSCSINLKRKF